MLRFIVHAALLFVLLGICNTLSAQEKPNTLSIEKERQKALEEFDVTEVPDLDAIRLFASELLSTPIEGQEKAQLKKLAKEANRVANLVNYIYDEYDDYYRDSYKYDFIQEKVIGSAQEYGKVFNEFVKIRNKSYFNLGIISRNKGETMEAFLYFKDAFRLSGFDCGSGGKPKSCLRWRAEQELQSLLGLSHIKAYVSWR